MISKQSTGQYRLEHDILNINNSSFLFYTIEDIYGTYNIIKMDEIKEKLRKTNFLALLRLLHLFFEKCDKCSFYKLK